MEMDITIIQELAELDKLYESGFLTLPEYKAYKWELLNSPLAGDGK